MKKELTQIEELLLAYPNLEYEGGSLYNGDDFVVVDAKPLIDTHYENFDSLCPRGADYINQKLFGDYSEAFIQIPVPKLK